MASSNTLRASSSTSNCDSYNYDVFLSFRGEDTRYNFTDHLYATLAAHGIHTFRDEEELEKGGDIASDLLRAIKESEIFIIIFSKNYADSKWCLKELVKIVDCMTEKKSTVLPVFYHVEPRDVRHQRGSFEDAFLYHAKDADQEKEKTIETWKNALKTAASLKGYHVKENQSEAKFIEKIREDIISRLNRMPLYVGENIVGIDFHLEQLKSQIKTELDEVHMVGIYGIGGIGKTTISMAIYNDISSQFDGSVFLGNIGGKREDELLQLQKTLLQEILKCERPTFNHTSAGINEIKKKLRWKRVLIVLDDVDNYTELEKLAGKHGWYGEKSLIIITTKNKHLLERYEVEAVYEVQKFNYKKSTELFSWWAFNQNASIPEFESLSNSIVKYADGLPIALKVLGSMLFKKSIAVWESAWEKLKKIPHNDVQSVLKVSYDKLDDTEQGMFLDIACFFRGKDKDVVSSILGSCAESGIDALHDRCLITISGNKLDMHDLVQQMGREIVRQQCIEEPGKRSRLWDPNDVDSVLTRNTGTEAIEGLFVELLASSRIQFPTNFFTKLNRLRLLKVYRHWSLYCENPEILHNLKVINLSWSEHLVEIPDFSRVPNLEILILRGCGKFVGLPEIKGNMSKLREIDLGLTAIRELPSSIGHLEALEHLNLNSCSNLASLPESIGNLSMLIEIDLSETAIKELPSSIGHLKALKHLNLNCCCNLVSLPESIGHLEALEHLYLYCCFNLVSLPESIWNLSTLIEIDLGQTTIKELSSSIGHLKALEYLYFYYCKNLVSLPESIGYLSTLIRIDLSRTGIKELPSSIGHLKALKYLDFYYCKDLVSLPESIGYLSMLIKIDLSKTAIKELPSSIGHLKALKHLDLESCTELVSLPESIWNLSSLETLHVLQCPKLERLEVTVCLKPRNLTCLILEGGICWSNNSFSSLKTLNLQHNKMEGEVLNHRDFPLSSLVELCIRNSEGMESDSSHLSSLKVSCFGNFNLMARGIPSGIFHQSSLESLSIHNCNLMEEGIPSDIWNLSSLVELSLSNCNLMDGEILNPVCHLSSLKKLSLEGNHFSSIPAGISRLSHSRGLNLSHCNKLEGIPELPSSLRFLDLHCSDGILSSPSLLSIPSLLNCFKSELIQEVWMKVGSSEFRGKGMSIVIPRSSGIVEGIENQSMRSYRVKIEVPQIWYENNDLLGFAVCCVYGPMFIDDPFDEESPFDISCWLEIGRNDSFDLSIKSGHYCNEHNGDSASDQVWVIYYPKDEFKEEYHSNQWTSFRASFHGSLKVKECGIHPIYGCFKCQRNEECERKHCLKGEAINQLPIIECRPTDIHTPKDQDISSFQHNTGCCTLL